MTPPSASGASRLALTAAIVCYVSWGLQPLLFQFIATLGLTPIEVLAHRTIWATPLALIFVLVSRQWGEVKAICRRPRTLAALALSGLLIASNWGVFVWAVNDHRILETSLGYYINPLINVAAGALIFRERLDGFGKTAIGLAAVGVIIQTVALGHLPWVSLVLAVGFGAYGVVRKAVAASAQTGLFLECLFLAIPSTAFVLWLEASGHGHALATPATPPTLLVLGLMTAGPLVLFSWSARRLPLSAMGFIQFITPTITFTMGVVQGEPFTPLRALSFAFIWAGGAAFAFGALRGRTVPPAQSPA